MTPFFTSSNLVLFFVINIVIVGSMNSNDIRNHLSTRTPYRYRANNNDSRIKYPNCKDKKVWMMIRHGTRMPSDKDILASSELTDLKFEILLQNEYGQGQLKKEQLQKFEEWKPDYNIDHESFLTQEGQDEMILLAERMQKRFPNAIKDKYDNKTFLFRYTATQRTQQSARYFTNGLFEKKQTRDIIFEPATKVDAVLRFYKHCDRWQTLVKKNPDTYKEVNMYINSLEMNKTLESVSKILGLNRVLKFETVNTMYKFCGYETSWNKYHISPWCYAFDKESIQIMEYYQDLRSYWIDGYGYDLTYRQACMAIKHMIENFDRKDSPHASFMFSHSGTILKMLTHLNLYRPEAPLRGDAIVRDREWRLSNIDCFGANLAFVLFKCSDGDYVLTLHQEKPIKLPGCDQHLCPLNQMKKQFHDSIYNCDYDDMCRLEKIEEH